MRLPAFSRFVDWAVYAALAASIVVFVSRKLSGPDEGKPAAAFELPVVGAPDARRFRLADHLGKPVLLEVMASWCGACKNAAPTLSDAFRKYGDRGVTFVAVSMDGSAERAAALKQEWGIPYDVLLDDGSLSRSYGIKALPTLVLIGPTGLVEHVSTGAPSVAELDRWLAKL